LGKQAFDRKLEEIEGLRSAPEEDAVAALRRALRDRGNFVVGKAAAIAGAREFRQLIPDLLAAFDRFMTDPVKSDPQCWAKNALAKTLKDLEHPDPEVFLRGIAHIQMEAVFGGREDTAVTLRGACALALVATRLDTFEILTYLTDLLADSAKPVRIDAARAMAQLSAQEALLPLRLKALVGDRDPEVVGHCLAAMLSLAPRLSLPFAARFLKEHDPDIRIEAAAVLAESREPGALGYLKNFWEVQTDPQVRATFLALLAGSPLEDAAGFLLEIVESASEPLAVKAVAALRTSRFREQMGERLASVVADRQSPILMRALRDSTGV
jgi:HEAT repeat protein